MTEQTEQDDKAVTQTSVIEPYSGSCTSPDGKHSFEISVGDDGIAYGISNGYENEEAAHGVRALFFEVHSHLGRPYPICFDISGLKEISPAARKIWSNTALAEDSPFTRVAVYGGGFFISSLMNFYARIAKMPVRLFKTKEDAVAWLEEQTP
jgi:hypothetical protein